MEANLQTIRDAGIVLAQLEIPIETIEFLAMLCAREGIPLILDSAPSIELPTKIIKSVTWFTPNETEAAFYGGGEQLTFDPVAYAQTKMAWGCRGVLLKMGGRGVFLASDSEPGELVPAFPVWAIDTNVAGDAFNGASPQG